MATQIHPTAVVEPGAELGDGVSVGPHSYIEAGAVIGENTSIASSVWISRFVCIGRDNRIFHGAALGGPPQDLKFGGEITTLEIEDRNTIREFVTLNRGTRASYKTTIGSDNIIMAYVHVAHDCALGDHLVLANSVNMGGHVTIEDWAILGGLLPIHQFCRVGMHSMVGTGTRIVQDVPPFALVGAEPTRVAGINTIGLTRRGFPKDTISALKKAFHLIYKSKISKKEALNRIREELPKLPEIEHLISFIEASERGII